MREKNSCPAKSCREPDAAQEPIAGSMIQAIDTPGDWVKSALRCSHCGCVYSLEDNTKKVRGYLDNPVLSGWLRIW